jgi:uncharacterized protein YggT (Ycf19 family)
MTISKVLTISLGAGTGAAAAIFAIVVANVLPEAARKVWGELLAWIAHPVAMVIAAITRQRLQAELSISIHLIAIVVTFMVLGAFVGWLLCKT